MYDSLSKVFPAEFSATTGMIFKLGFISSLAMSLIDIETLNLE